MTSRALPPADRDRRLRTLLRAGDPAAHDDQLDPAASAALRQRILAVAQAAEEEPAQQQWLAWRRLALPAGLATLAAASLLAVLRWQGPSAPPAPPAAARPAPPVVADRLPPTTAPPAASHREGSPAKTVQATPPRPRRPRTTGGSQHTAPATTATPAPEQLARRLEIETPGGTRLIWVLTPTTAP